jgi:predicted alpha/beta-hydrolase family hydrolase
MAKNGTLISIRVSPDQSVSALLWVPESVRAAFVFAHGAGAGMTHPFLSDFAAGLAERGIATLRFQFPYMERGSKRPDTAGVAQATVRAAVEEAERRLPGVALFAGGKSFGGRMTSQAQAEVALPGVRGLIFLGFPLHPAGKPSRERAKHLSNVRCPMLFLQGARDSLAEVDLVKEVTRELGNLATLKLLTDADHSFDVRARSGRKAEDVRHELVNTAADWIADVLSLNKGRSRG